MLLLIIFFSLEYEPTKAINVSSYGSVFANSTDLSSSPPGTPHCEVIYGWLNKLGFLSLKES